MDNNVIELIAIIDNKIGSIIYLDGKTGISIEEFLKNNPQIKILNKYEHDYKYFKQSFDYSILNKKQFNIIFIASKKY